MPGPAAKPNELRDRNDFAQVQHDTIAAVALLLNLHNTDSPWQIAPWE